MIGTLLANNIFSLIRGSNVTTFSPHIALHSGPPTISNEITAAGYLGDQPIPTSDWVFITEDSHIVMSNSRRITFGDPSGRWDPTYAGIWNGAPAADNILIPVIITPKMISSSIDEVFIAPGAFRIRLPIFTP